MTLRFYRGGPVAVECAAGYHWWSDEEGHGCVVAENVWAVIPPETYDAWETALLPIEFPTRRRKEKP